MSRGHTTTNACPICGSNNRAGADGCWDCFWDGDPEALEHPDEDVRPNYVSLNEARFIMRTAGAAELREANTAGPEGAALREKYRAMMKGTDAHHA